MEIPSIHVEDTSHSYPILGDTHANLSSNLEVLRKIDALLGHNLDLSNLTGTTLPPDQVHASMPMTHSLPTHSLAASYSSQTYPTTQQLCSPNQISPVSSSDAWSSYLSSLTALQTTSQAPIHTPQDATLSNYNLFSLAGALGQIYQQQQQQQQQAAAAQSTMSVVQPPMQVMPDQNWLNRYNLSQMAAAMSKPPSMGYPSQPMSAATVQNSNLSATSESFIPGAISNRTLETLTENTMRPFRAIKAETRGYHTQSSDSSGQKSVGIIGDRLSPGSDGRSRSVSPADSDTSGYNTSQSDLNDTALAELMRSLQLSQDGCSTQQQQQQQNINQLTSLVSNGGGASGAELIRALGLPSDKEAILGANPNDFSLSADMFISRPPSALNTLFATNSNDPYSIEKAAKLYRNAATICEPTCTWSGQLPNKVHKNPTYSCKVFLGGVPWDITEAGLQYAFRSYGPMRIEWPGKEGKHPRYPPKAGYVYVLFESDKSVKLLLQACTHDFSNGGEYFFKISSRRMRSKEVQVIPWTLGDSNFVKQPAQRLDPQKTVFVGALHGMMNAEGLAHVMHDLFGNVLYAGIDTDKHKYPIGSGRVTFSSHKSYMKAVNAAFVEVKTPKFTKKIQIDPYLEDSVCSSCNLQPGPYFCRDLSCFRYYCKNCWQWCHSAETSSFHKPLMRNGRSPNSIHSGSRNNLNSTYTVNMNG